MVKTAWAENPSVAIQLQTRFPSLALTRDLRWLLLNFPEVAMGEPDALQILLEHGLPNDMSYQLKVCG